MGQHIGDLETPEALAALEHSVADLQHLFACPAAVVVSDLHPDYASTRLAERLAAAGSRHLRVQHHYAHVLACMAENELSGDVLGVSWDGTGYGPDGTVWGGEFLHASASGYERFAHLRTWPLPGGEAAVREPRRVALGLLWEWEGEAALSREDLPCLQAFSEAEIRIVVQALRRGLNAPPTSSAGRLFDGVASLCGVRQRLEYEGQAAMELEYGLDHSIRDAYPLSVDAGGGGPLQVDWRPMLGCMVRDLTADVPAGVVSARFHNTLSGAIVDLARRSGLEQVVLTGGCMQNQYLLEQTVARLRGAGLRPYWHQRVPPNDGGICLGQLVAGRSLLTP